jgi:hypothetical protein
VPDANAQTPIPAWTVVDAVCNMGAFQWSTTGFDYAEVALPGRSKADLARTVVMHHYPPEVADNQRQVTPPNTAYRDSYVGNVMVRDGAVGVVCLPDWTVTFTIPPPL